MKMRSDVVVAVCNTHGMFPVVTVNNNDGTIDHCILEQRIPDNMQLIHITATVLGVPNVSNLEILKRINRLVYNKSNAFYASKNKMTPRQMAEIIRTEICEINKENIKEINRLYHNSLKHPIKESETLKYYQNYSHYSDNMFHLNVLNEGNAYADKKYIQFTPDELAEMRIVNNAYMNKILIFENKPIDVFGAFDAYGMSDNHMSLSDFLQFVEGLDSDERKKKTVIFVDLSCSVTQMDDRTNRKLKRRGLIRNDLLSEKQYMIE
jgi:hypothetical protein